MLSLDFLVLKVLFCCACTLDYQTQVDMKQAGQPEQASLNQCQIIAQNLCSAHAQLMLAIMFLCKVNDISLDWSLFPCDLTLMPDQWLLARVQPFTIPHIVIGLSLHIHSFHHLRLVHSSDYNFFGLEGLSSS